MKQHIVICAVGGDRVGMVHELSKAVADCGGSISESRMTSLGNEFAMLLLVNGNWHTLAKLEGEFKKLADATGMNIQLRRTEERAARNDMLPYSIDVVCLDQTGIVAGLSGFFAQRGVDIAELSTRSYAAAHTGAPMFSVQMIVNVPSRLHIGVLREEFMDFCDHLNLDAIFEPVKELSRAHEQDCSRQESAALHPRGHGRHVVAERRRGRRPWSFISIRATTRRGAPRKARLLPAPTRNSRKPRPLIFGISPDSVAVAREIQEENGRFPSSC